MANFKPFKDQYKREAILEPYKYLAEIPGKEVRSMLVAAFNSWLQVPPDQLDLIKELIQMLHNSSLLIDDIEDNSKMRRGRPVAHLVYGIPSTINCANYVYFLAMEKCYEIGHPEAVKIFLEELLALHRGQGLDIYWRDNLKCPTEEEYSEMVIAKTGGLFRLAVRVMKLFSTHTGDFVPLVNDLGQYFQIRDDYMNLKSDVYSQHKSFCEDLTEGKFSFPIIHSIRKDLDDHRLISIHLMRDVARVDILKQRTESRDLKIYAVEFMDGTNSFEYTKKEIERYKNRIIEQIAQFGGNPELVKFVEDLWTSMP